MSGGPRDYDGLIDPSQFPFRSDAMDVGALGQAADLLRSLGRDLSGGAADLVASWSGLSAVYQGPQQEQVWGLMGPVVDAAGRVESDLSTAAGRLDDLADSLALLRTRMAGLEERAAVFRARVIDGVEAPITEGADMVVTWGTVWATIPWNQDTDTVAQNEDLLLEHAELVEQISAVSADCHNALMDLVRWATDEHDVVGVQAEQLMDRRVEYAWGTPVAEDRSVGESVGHGIYTFAFNIAAGVAGLGLGYDLRMEEYREDYRDQIATGLADAWVSAGTTTAWGLFSGANPALADWLRGRLGDDQRQWLHDREVLAGTIAGDLVGIDMQAHANGEDGLWRWREDGVATGTESFLNVGSMFVPSGGGAAAGALRTGSVGARLLRVVTGAGDLLLPGTSALTYGSIRLTSGLRNAIARLDEVPVVSPNHAGVAGEVADLADTNSVALDRPPSHELLDDGVMSVVDDMAGADGVDLVSNGASPVDAPPVQVERTHYATAISTQKQARHMLDSPHYEGGGYFVDPRDAQVVLDAFHAKTAEVLGLKPNGDPVVRVEGTTGFHLTRSRPTQLTDVFFIKGTRSTSVVPYNPTWVPRPPRS